MVTDEEEAKNQGASIPHNHQSHEIKLFKKRWLMLFLFSTLSFSNGLNWIVFSPISEVVMRQYSVGAMAINILSMTYMVSFIPTIFPASYFIDKYGERNGFIVGAILNAVGSIVRVLPFPFYSISSSVPYSFYIVFIGQLLTALTQPFIIGLPPKIAQNWFGEKERITATAIGALANQVGIALGFFLSPAVVPNNSSDINISILLIILAVVAVISLILIFCFYKNKPPLPPSRSSSLTSNHSNFDEYRLFDVLKLLFNDKNYVNLLFCYGNIVGSFYAISTILDQILSSVGYEESTTSILGMIFVFLGIPGALLSGYIADRTRAYKLLLILCCFISFLSMSAYAMVFNQLNPILLYICGSFMGFFMTALLPICMDFSVEITFPLPEATVSNTLILSSQLFSSIQIVISTLLLDYAGADCVNFSFVLFIAIPTIIVLFFNGKNKRLHAEAQN